MKDMTLGSLFDGIGGFPLAGHWLGIRPAWASEIEKAPVSITKRHLPEMRHLGDIRKINGAEIEPVDVITFGSPCQDLSVAGNRAGLEGERSGLFSEAVRIIREMREATHGEYPAYAVWENVPGALSSNGGEDFRAIIEAIARVADPTAAIPRPAAGRWQSAGSVLGDGWSLAWRILDAQYWGVPQRRRRIYLVAVLGGASAAQILFKRSGVHRYPSPGGAAGQADPSDAGGGAAGAIPIHDKATRYRGGGAGRRDDGASNGLLIGQPGEPSPSLDTAGRHAVAVRRDSVGALRANGLGMRYAPKGEHDLDFCIMTAGFMAGQSADAGGIGYAEETSPTLRASSSGINQTPTVLAAGFDLQQITSRDNRATVVNGAPQPTLCKDGRPSVMIEAGCQTPWESQRRRIHAGDIPPTLVGSDGGGGRNPGGLLMTCAMQGYGDYTEDGRANTQRAAHDVTTSTLGTAEGWPNAARTLTTRGDSSPCADRGINIVMPTAHAIVRRLTPTECERIQGYPDGWTAHGHDGKPISDSARYKAIGNSVALPCVLYILEGIKTDEKRRRPHGN